MSNNVAFPSENATLTLSPCPDTVFPGQNADEGTC